MTTQTKAWLINIHERNRGQEYAFSVVTVASDEAAASTIAGEVARHWYCSHDDEWVTADASTDDDEEHVEVCQARWQDDCGWLHVGHVLVKVASVREIPTEHYVVLREYVLDSSARAYEFEKAPAASPSTVGLPPSPESLELAAANLTEELP
jgi:hypothetical protein